MSNATHGFCAIQTTWLPGTAIGQNNPLWPGSSSRSDNHPTRPSTNGQANAKWSCHSLSGFPEEVSGLQLLYSTLDRDLMQVERSCQCITLQLLTALAETPEDIVQLAAFSSPASRGVWITRLYLVPTGLGSLTDGSGRYPVPLDAHPFRVVVRTVQIAASLGGFIDAMALAVSLSALVDCRYNICAPKSESTI